jgi:hypothetical protein
MLHRRILCSTFHWFVEEYHRMADQRSRGWIVASYDEKELGLSGSTKGPPEPGGPFPLKLRRR